MPAAAAAVGDGVRRTIVRKGTVNFLPSIEFPDWGRLIHSHPDHYDVGREIILTANAESRHAAKCGQLADVGYHLLHDGSPIKKKKSPCEITPGRVVSE
jgi:hypothetical protein